MDKKGKGKPLIARDFPIRKPTSVVTLNGFIGIPSLEPILSSNNNLEVEDVESLEVEELESSSKLSRDLFEGQQATVRGKFLNFTILIHCCFFFCELYFITANGLVFSAFRRVYLTLLLPYIVLLFSIFLLGNSTSFHTSFNRSKMIQ